MIRTLLYFFTDTVFVIINFRRGGLYNTMNDFSKNNNTSGCAEKAKMFRKLVGEKS